MRPASVRWKLLLSMLGQIERCLEANSRLEAALYRETLPRRRGPGRPRKPVTITRGGPIGRRIDAAQRRIDYELDCLTAELLLRDLERKKEKAA
jgi:hypothetical protein